MTPGRRLAGWLAARDVIPTAGQAVLGYYAQTGDFDRDSIRLKRVVDRRTAAMIDDAFEPVEAAIAEAFDAPAVEFTYDTKLTLPAELTLGQLYRTARERADGGTDPVALSVWADGDGEAEESDAVGPIRFREPIADDEWRTAPETPQELVDRAEYLTRLVIAALIDGDMRDAINDEEYADFEVSIDIADDQRPRVAELAQEALQSELDAAFDRLPDEIREIYDWAVDLSEAHQQRDPHFRELYVAARDGDADARERVREEYREAPIDELDAEIDLFEADHAGLLPYLKTQYARVGVIYDGMVEMYRRGGLPIDDAFKRSIVLAIIGAQIWLDDIEDFPADRAEGQLTPATAEYVLAESDRAAYERIVDVSERYLDRAETEAAETDSPLTGIATEYIYRSGDPSVLPGHGDR